MKKVLMFGSLVIASTPVFSADDWKLPSGEPQFRRGPGAELAIGNCAVCHSSDYLSMQPPLNAAGWSAIVQKMREKYGAPLPADKVDDVVRYLVTAYGKK
jgi:mono/diheme cytochrome c family protein